MGIIATLTTRDHNGASPSGVAALTEPERIDPVHHFAAVPRIVSQMLISRNKKLAFPTLLAVCLAFPSITRADLTFVSDQTSFQSSVSGMLFLGTEDFEEVDGNALPINSSNGMSMDDPLTQTSTNSPYPNGINMPITVQANTLGGNPTAPSPRGTNGLTVQRQGFRSTGNFLYRFTSTAVVASSGGDSIDYIFDPADQVKAVSLLPKALDPLDIDVTIRVYDTANVLLGSTSVITNSGHVLESGVDVSLNPFLGIISNTDTIGRINLHGVRPGGSNSVSEGADNISMYSAIPEPGAFGLFGVLAVTAFWRRRR